MDLGGQWRSETVDADGATLQCYRTAEGPPVVFSHVCEDTGRRWVPLADEYTLVAYDASGHGRSDAPEEGYAIGEHVGDLRAVVEGLGLERPRRRGPIAPGRQPATAAAAPIGTRRDRPNAQSGK